jgi:transcriptional regulator with XRE-family HTH domain
MTPEEFRAIRASLGLSQAALARLLVRDVMTLSRYERGLHPIPAVVARAMRALATDRSA